MSNAIAAAADLNAPPVTKLLADFVATHPSQGWTPEVEHEAHRTFLNWLGVLLAQPIMKVLSLRLPLFGNFNQRPKPPF